MTIISRVVLESPAYIPLGRWRVCRRSGKFSPRRRRVMSLVLPCTGVYTRVHTSRGLHRSSYAHLRLLLSRSLGSALLRFLSFDRSGSLLFFFLLSVLLTWGFGRRGLFLASGTWLGWVREIVSPAGRSLRFQICFLNVFENLEW